MVHCMKYKVNVHRILQGSALPHFTRDYLPQLNVLDDLHEVLLPTVAQNVGKSIDVFHEADTLNGC